MHTDRNSIKRNILNFTPIFVIEPFDEDTGFFRFADALRRYGQEVIEIPSDYPIHTDIDRKIKEMSESRPLIIQSSFEFVKGFPRGTFIDFYDQDRFIFSKYVDHVKDFLLNKDFIILRKSFLKRCYHDIFNLFCKDNIKRMFIRPDAGNKTFSGFVIMDHPDVKSPYRFEKEATELLSFEIDELVVISAPKKIDVEYRIIIIDQEPVGVSQYRLEGFVDYKMSKLSELPVEANTLIHDVIKSLVEYQIYTLDICKSNGSWALIEINSFCYASMYQVDMDTVIPAYIKFVKKNF